MKILIIEDDFTNRMLLRNLIQEYCGVSCDAASDGLEGVKAFQTAGENNTPYDLIFMDIMMPNLDGIGALKLIRGLEKENKDLYVNPCRIIMTTALNDKKTIDVVYKLGCNGFITKPIKFEQIKDEISKAGIEKQ